MAQYRELAAFAQFASDLDQTTKSQLLRGEKLTEVLKQPQYSPLSVAEQVSILFAANEGILDDISNNDEDDDENTNNEKTYVKRRNTNQGIQRPIICICNDLYAKQLSLLRKEALVYNLKKIDEKKLFDLLYSITKKENLPIDKTTIKNICELCNSDIRSCLLCLQFFSYHKKNSELISEIIHDKEKLKY